jgi:hypothetical protein
MTVGELIRQLTQLSAEATVIVVNEESGDAREVQRACVSEDPPTDGSDEVWVVINDD